MTLVDKYFFLELQLSRLFQANYSVMTLDAQFWGLGVRFLAMSLTFKPWCVSLYLFMFRLSLKHFFVRHICEGKYKCFAM